MSDDTTHPNSLPENPDKNRDVAEESSKNDSDYFSTGNLGTRSKPHSGEDFYR